jgi:aspartate kinase
LGSHGWQLAAVIPGADRSHWIFQRAGNPPFGRGLRVSCTVDRTKVSLRLDADHRGVLPEVTEPLSAAGIEVDLMTERPLPDGQSELLFTIPTIDLPQAEPLLAELAAGVGADGYAADAGIATVVVTGFDSMHFATKASKLVAAFRRAEIDVQLSLHSPRRFAYVVAAAQAGHAVATARACLESD